jgi:hypothetical protein
MVQCGNNFTESPWKFSSLMTYVCILWFPWRRSKLLGLFMYFCRADYTRTSTYLRFGRQCWEKIDFWPWWAEGRVSTLLLRLRELTFTRKKKIDLRDMYVEFLAHRWQEGMSSSKKCDEKMKWYYGKTKGTSWVDCSFDLAQLLWFECMMSFC